MNILITPRVRSFYDDFQLEYSIDRNWFSFLDKVLKNAEIEVYFPEKDIENCDVLIISGGNNLDIFSTKKEDEICNKFNQKLIEEALKRNIKIIGICYGAQLLAHNFKSLIEKTDNHIGFHNVFNENNNDFSDLEKEISVNSYHNYAISKLGIDLCEIYKAQDNTIEMFKHKKYEIYGIMWHPERYHDFCEFDIKIFQKIIKGF